MPGVGAFIEFSRILILFIMKIQNRYYIYFNKFQFGIFTLRSLEINAVNSFMHSSLKYGTSISLSVTQVIRDEEIRLINKEIVTSIIGN